MIAIHVCFWQHQYTSKEDGGHHRVFNWSLLSLWQSFPLGKKLPLPQQLVEVAVQTGQAGQKRK